MGKLPIQTKLITELYEDTKVDCCGHLQVKLQYQKDIPDAHKAITMVGNTTGWPEITQMGK